MFRYLYDGLKPSVAQIQGTLPCFVLANSPPSLPINETDILVNPISGKITGVVGTHHEVQLAGKGSGIVNSIQHFK